MPHYGQLKLPKMAGILKKTYHENNITNTISLYI